MQIEAIKNGIHGTFSDVVWDTGIPQSAGWTLRVIMQPQEVAATIAATKPITGPTPTKKKKK